MKTSLNNLVALPYTKKLMKKSKEKNCDVTALHRRRQMPDLFIYIEMNRLLLEGYIQQSQSLGYKDISNQLELIKDAYSRLTT